MSALRMRMIEDMTLSGLAAGTQATYIDAVRKLAAPGAHQINSLRRRCEPISCTCARAEQRAGPSRRTITASSISIGKP